jgi:ParB-like chromosome segregation protein Spo0J
MAKKQPLPAQAPRKSIALAERIELWPVGRLIPYKNNPRVNDHVLEKMVRSFREFGFVIPILARSNGEVIDGHFRLKAAKKMEMAEVPVIVCDSWSESKIRAFRLQVNRSATWAVWDDNLLASELMELNSTADLDLSLTGFEMQEVAEIVSDSFGGTAKTTTAQRNAGSSAKLEFRVVVDCSGESDQARMLKRFQAEGLKCRPLIS